MPFCFAEACACEGHLIGTCEQGDEDRLRQIKLPLAGIASERAHGGGVHPGGLRGFAHLGLHVGVDLRGRGRQLRACHGSLSASPERQTPSRQRPRSFLCLCPCSSKLTERRRRTKRASPVSLMLLLLLLRRKGRSGGSVRLPAASRAPQTH